MKGLGYSISTLSVFLLGFVAWPAGNEPMWKAVATSVGMATSILGMYLRYLSHRKEKAEIDRMRFRVLEGRCK